MRKYLSHFFCSIFKKGIMEFLYSFKSFIIIWISVFYILNLIIFNNHFICQISRYTLINLSVNPASDLKYVRLSLTAPQIPGRVFLPGSRSDIRNNRLSRQTQTFDIRKFFLALYLKISKITALLFTQTMLL